MRKVSFVLLGLSFLISSCYEGDSVNYEGGDKAKMQIRLTDAPAAYDAVNIDIQGIEINWQEEEGDSSSWQSIVDVNTGVYNLLELSAGIDTLLAEIDLPAGRVNQVRLILGDRNSLKMGDSLVDLTTPSAQQSGLKLNVNTDIETGTSYNFLLDFDAARSVVEAGSSGKFLLKPTIRVIVESDAETGDDNGSISGTATPAGTYPVFAFNEMDTITTFSDTLGYFVLMGVPVGTYTVQVTPDTSGSDSTLMVGTVEEVEVNGGELTELGEISLEQQN